MITHHQFYYVRHGQTDWNLNRKLQGNTDIPLNDNGIAQAHEAKDRLAGIAITTICCSPLQRARKTADIINQALNCPILEIAGLKECNFGSHEGGQQHDWLADWLNGDDSTTPPEVEPFSDFINRGRQAINQALTHPGPVLIVAHGGLYIPVNQVLPKDQQRRLINGQPLRHDPPLSPEHSWQVSHL